MIKLFLLFLLLGGLAGLLAGTLGLGGGVVIVPALLLIFAALGFESAVLAQMAVATSLATIVVTSANAIRTHHQLGHVRWALTRRLAGGIAAGGLAGAFVADWLPGETLARLFGFFAMLIAVRMAWPAGGNHAETGCERMPGRVALTGAGGLIGMASSIFGIGGGSLTVPFLSGRGLPMQQAVAVSAVCGLVIALAGGTGFIIAGWNEPGRPAWSLGYIYLPAFAGIILTSFPMARVGARLAHRLPSARLKKVFAAVLFVIGLKLAWDAL